MGTEGHTGKDCGPVCAPVGELGLQGLDFCFTLIIAHKMHVHPPKPKVILLTESENRTW